MQNRENKNSIRLSQAITENPVHHARHRDFLIGVLPGEGIGPEVIGAALKIIDVLNTRTGFRFTVETGGDIGLPAFRACGMYLSDAVTDFCADIFARQGVILCGPGGGRFVYELRGRFGLFCKLTPIQPYAALNDSLGPIRPEMRTGVDIVVVRENISGAYFGEWGRQNGPGPATAYQRIQYTDEEIARILNVGIRLAKMRRGRLCLVLKPNGVPTISQLWLDTLDSLNRDTDLQVDVLEVDNAVYQLIANARNLDVVVAPNMFGDILSDCGALLLGSRGMSFSGNFDGGGNSVFQTAHGAAYDLVDTGRANPIGQILSLAMLLREGFGLSGLSLAIEAAIADVLASGCRTDDITCSGCKSVKTDEMTAAVAEALAVHLQSEPVNP